MRPADRVYGKHKTRVHTVTAKRATVCIAHARYTNKGSLDEVERSELKRASEFDYRLPSVKEGGMDAVKLEGGGPARVAAAKACVDAGIAVMVGSGVQVEIALTHGLKSVWFRKVK